jgi:hypothetical protein
MGGRKFLHAVEILGWFLIFVFIANLPLSGRAYGRESTLFRINPGCCGKPLWNHVRRRHLRLRHGLSADEVGHWLDRILAAYFCLWQRWKLPSGGRHSCWPLRDQRPVAGDQWQQPPIT